MEKKDTRSTRWRKEAFGRSMRNKNNKKRVREAKSIEKEEEIDCRKSSINSAKLSLSSPRHLLKGTNQKKKKKK